MRRTLLSSALRTAWANLRFVERVAIFEVGHVYYKAGAPDIEVAATGVGEPRRLSVLLTGPRQARWHKDVDREMVDYFDLKGIIDALLESLGLADKVQWAKGAHPSFHPGRCAQVTLGERELGGMGELHPLVRDAFDMPEQLKIIDQPFSKPDARIEQNIMPFNAACNCGIGKTGEGRCHLTYHIVIGRLFLHRLGSTQHVHQHHGALPRRRQLHHTSFRAKRRYIVDDVGPGV